MLAHEFTPLDNHSRNTKRCKLRMVYTLSGHLFVACWSHARQPCSLAWTSPRMQEGHIPQSKSTEMNIGTIAICQSFSDDNFHVFLF